MINSIITKLQLLITKYDIKSKVADRVQPLFKFAQKYSLLIIYLYLILINPAILTYIFERGIDGDIIVCFIEIILSGIILNKTINICSKKKGLFVYCLVYLVLISHAGLDLNPLSTSTAILGLSIISVFIFSKRNYIFFLPLFCFAISWASPNFYTEFFTSLLVFFYLTSSESNINVPWKNTHKFRKILFFLCGVLFYFSSLIVNYINQLKTVKRSAMLWQFFNDYFHFGLIPRGLVSTIRRIILGSDTSFVHSFIFIVAFQCLCLFTIFSLIHVLWKSSQTNPYAKLLCLALLSCESIRNYTTLDMIINFDSLLVCFFIISVILLIKNRILVLIPLLVAIAMFAHHGFGIFLFPALFTILLFFFLSDKNYNIKILIIILLTSAIALGLFIYFHFFSHLYIKLPLSDACNYIGEYTGKIYPDNLDQLSSDELLSLGGYFLMNVKYILYNGKIANYGVQKYASLSLFNSSLLLISMIPLFILVISNFKSFEKSSGIKGFIAKVAPFTLLINLASYLEVDCGRWNSFIILSLVLILLSSLLINPGKSWINQIPEKYRILFCKGIIILMILIPPMGVWAN